MSTTTDAASVFLSNNALNIIVCVFYSPRYDVNRKKKGLHPTEYRDLVLEEELPLIQVGLEEVARSNNPPVPSSNLM